MDKLSLGEGNGTEGEPALWRPEDDEDVSTAATKPAGQEWFLDEK
jgi:hypothetical protein